MAIYKLGEIGTFKGGISTLKKDKYDKGIYFINYMDIFNNVFIDNTKIKTMRLYDATEADINKYRVNFGDILFTASSEKREEIGMTSVFLNNESNIFNGFSKVFKFNDKSHFNPKYLAYYFRTKFVRDQIVSFATGYTRYNISQKDLEKIILVLPSLEEQEKIIDIIEPIEKQIVYFENLILKLESILRQYSKKLSSNEKMINIVNFDRGVVLKSENFKIDKKITGFIDVRSLSEGIFTKYVDFLPNSFISDVLLSLDGTPGRVSYSIEGFNGYAYNLKSNKISKGQILVDLINEKNQKIIFDNSQGTTIKHASKAKNKMLHFNSKQEIVDPIFKILVGSKQVKTKLEMIKSQIILLLIK
ncbi:restriction endonuclease subunit S [Mesoplasma tabanidae]|uniref:Type I restriction enzyme, S subunit n=1 Tax=Mesoplasma tabanidae TaxID=219745 RepID=A0A2K8P446_9MOLU|nr:restriction endonuclease subunit S [Mesoplasma tabanidae]ATZ21519.1 type I restriction enzyme, S subunit [Mesoplasma tabanidae]